MTLGIFKIALASEFEKARSLQCGDGQVNQDTSSQLDLTHIKGIIIFHFADHNIKVLKVQEITDRKKAFGGNKKELRAGLCEGSRG